VDNLFIQFSNVTAFSVCCAVENPVECTMHFFLQLINSTQREPCDFIRWPKVWFFFKFIGQTRDNNLTLWWSGYVINWPKFECGFLIRQFTVAENDVRRAVCFLLYYNQCTLITYKIVNNHLKFQINYWSAEQREMSILKKMFCAILYHHYMQK